MVPSGLASAGLTFDHVFVMLLALADARVFDFFKLLSDDDFCDLFAS